MPGYKTEEHVVVRSSSVPRGAKFDVGADRGTTCILAARLCHVGAHKIDGVNRVVFPEIYLRFVSAWLPFLRLGGQLQHIYTEYWRRFLYLAR